MGPTPAALDSFIERSHRILSISKAPTRDVANLQNWVDGTGAIAREETEFLGHRDELMSLVPPADIATSRIESWVEDMLIRFYRGFREVGTAEVQGSLRFPSPFVGAC